MDTYPHVFITSPDEWDPNQVPEQPFGDPMFDAYGIKSTKQFINTLSDNIRKWGAMDTLTSDGVTDLLHSLFIQDYQNEPYPQDQNKAENCFGPAKRYTNTVMNTSGCPACC